MKKLIDNVKKSLMGKKGASNLEVIIVMVVAIVIGAALFVFGGILKSTVQTSTSKANGMNSTINNQNMTMK